MIGKLSYRSGIDSTIATVLDLGTSRSDHSFCFIEVRDIIGRLAAGSKMIELLSFNLVQIENGVELHQWEGSDLLITRCIDIRLLDLSKENDVRSPMS